ncbi:MAG: hypothetical protein ACE5HE_03935 [Phycisphaerae bacterium]
MSASSSPSCADCHNGGVDRQGYVSPYKALADSVHSGLDCTDCHASVSLDDLNVDSSRPHGEPTVIADGAACAECHEHEAEAYKKHGRLDVGSDPDVPTCWSCHGAHDVYRSSSRRSHVHPVNLPRTCRACHTNVDLVVRHDVLRDAPIKMYQNSVHGTASRKGIYVAATCNDCHSGVGAGGKRTAHRILSGADPESTIYHFAIPDTCGQCHAPIARDYWDGIHGQLVKRGAIDSPVCTHCHGEHGIVSPDDPRSRVSAARLAEETCAPCHESAALNEKYGLAGGKLGSYIDSYHGLKSRTGNVEVANCASCHGAHRILPSSDPTSSIHPDNLRTTCGECHPGISSELASVAIHETSVGMSSGWPHFFTVLYYWIIGVTIGLMLLHCLADWVRHTRIMGDKPFIVRLTPNETAQHWLLAIAFGVLVLSGFSLRFSEAWWVQMMFGWGGGKGFEIRGLVHRVAAVLFTISCAWHLGYLFTARGGIG